MCKPLIFSIFALTACGGGNVFAQQLVHFWDFEGDAPWNDKAGTAHGTVPDPHTYSQVRDRAAIEDAAANFEASVTGQGEHLEVDGTDFFQPGGEPFSMTYWFRVEDDGAGVTKPRGIFDFSGNGADGAQSLFIGSTNELAFRIDTSTGGSALAKIPMSEDGEWHFVAATYDPSGNLEVHVDGAGADATIPAATGNVFHNTARLYLGSFNSSLIAADKGLDGDLDDVAIYSGVLSATQIAGLFDDTLSPPAFLLKKKEFVISRVERMGDNNTVYWDSKPGGSYSVWWSIDLEGWGELMDSIPGTGGELNYPHQTGVDQFFYRVQDDTDDNQ